MSVSVTSPPQMHAPANGTMFSFTSHWADAVGEEAIAPLDTECDLDIHSKRLLDNDACNVVAFQHCT